MASQRQTIQRIKYVREDITAIVDDVRQRDSAARAWDYARCGVMAAATVQQDQQGTWRGEASSQASR
jgi:hypothetical protein